MKFINPLENEKLYLYHYTQINTAINFILKDNTIKLSSFSKVNDPRENKSWDISLFVNEGIKLETQERNSLSKEVSEILKANAKMVCFSRDKPTVNDTFQPGNILCRGLANPSMWHHYAGEHNGVCLMFNKERLKSIFENTLKKRHLVHGNVKYSNEGSVPNLQGDPFVLDLLVPSGKNWYFDAIQNHFSLWYKELFFKKLIDWSNEDEYRWVYLDVNPGPIYLNFGDALEGILIGEEVDQTKCNQIKEYGVRYSIEIGKLTWVNGYPRIEPLVIRTSENQYHCFE